MKSKVKRYQQGGVLRDRYGNPVRSGSGEPIRTRYPDSSSMSEDSAKTRSSVEETRDSAPVMDYASMGKRAGATSMMSGPKIESVPKIDIKEDVIEDYEPPKSEKTSSGVFSNYSPRSTAEDSEKKSEAKPLAKKKKPTPKRVSQSFGVDEAGIEERSKTPMSAAKEPPLARIGRAIAGTVERASTPYKSQFMKKGGGSIKMASGGKTSSASSRADGCAQRGKTRGKMV